MKPTADLIERTLWFLGEYSPKSYSYGTSDALPQSVTCDNFRGHLCSPNLPSVKSAMEYSLKHLLMWKCWTHVQMGVILTNVSRVVHVTAEEWQPLKTKYKHRNNTVRDIFPRYFSTPCVNISGGSSSTNFTPSGNVNTAVPRLSSSMAPPWGAASV